MLYKIILNAVSLRLNENTQKNKLGFSFVSFKYFIWNLMKLG